MSTDNGDFPFTFERVRRPLTAPRDMEDFPLTVRRRGGTSTAPAADNFPMTVKRRSEDFPLTVRRRTPGNG